MTQNRIYSGFSNRQLIRELHSPLNKRLRTDKGTILSELKEEVAIRKDEGELRTDAGKRKKARFSIMGVPFQ